MPPTLVHVSDRPDIARFEPRPRSSQVAPGPPVVWAIDAANLPHYLLPRDCPRVCCWADEQTTDADRDRILGSAGGKVIAVESGWLDRIRAERLWLYVLPADTFRLEDANAGYWVSEVAVTPERVEPAGDLLARLVTSGVELRLTSSLWPLYDAVVASSVSFSIIRMRNAQAR